MTLSMKPPTPIFNEQCSFAQEEDLLAVIVHCTKKRSMNAIQGLWNRGSDGILKKFESRDGINLPAEISFLTNGFSLCDFNPVCNIRVSVYTFLNCKRECGIEQDDKCEEYTPKRFMKEVFHG